MPEDLKCKTCGETKPVSQFHQQARSKTGFAGSCRTCVNRKRRSAKPGPPGIQTQLKTLIRKGDLASVKKLIDYARANGKDGVVKFLEGE